MSNIFSRSRVRRASVTAMLAGLTIVGVAANANAYDGWHRQWGRDWPHHEWRGPYYGGWYRPYYYAPPPVVAYPPAYGYYGYYGPPGMSLNFNVPL